MSTASRARVHASAQVHPSAELGAGVEVGPCCVVGKGVRLGEGTRLLSHVVIEGPTTLGARNVVHPFAVLGSPAQTLHPDAEPGPLHVGDGNVLREHVTIHRGTRGRATTVGDHNMLMVGAHVAHDVRLGSHCTLVNSAQLAGHAVVEDWATLGGLSGVVPFARVGQSAFVAAGSICERDVPPFVIVGGARARPRAVNVSGLRRRGVPARSIAALREAFRALFVGRRPRAQVLGDLELDDLYVAALVHALTSSNDGSLPTERALPC